MNEDDLYYEPGYDDYNHEPYDYEDDAEYALASAGFGLDESYNPFAEF
jgi:hypothetical protein